MLEAVQIESNHSIDIDSFVPRDEIDKRYLNHPYYIAPDGKAEAIHVDVGGFLGMGTHRVAIRAGNFVYLKSRDLLVTTMSKDEIKALKAEGVDVNFWDYPEQHKLKIYSEAKWWNHPPTIPQSMPGNAYINANHIFLPLFYEEAPELTAQYIKAFEMGWAKRSELAKA